MNVTRNSNTSLRSHLRLATALKPLICFVKLAMPYLSWMDLEVSLRLLLPGVCGEKTIIRNGKELYDFLCERMVVDNAYDRTKPILNGKFYIFHLRRLRSIVQYFIVWTRSTFQEH